MNDLLLIVLVCVISAAIGALAVSVQHDEASSNCRSIERNLNIPTVYSHQNDTCYIVEKDGTLTPFKTVEFKVNP